MKTRLPNIRNTRKRSLDLTAKLSILVTCLYIGGCSALFSVDPQSQTVGDLINHDAPQSEPVRITRTRGESLGVAEAESTQLLKGYYEDVVKLNADPAIQIESMRRLADLQVRAVDEGETEAGEGLQRAILTYRYILEKHPRYANRAQVLYQLARASQLSGDDNAAIRNLQLLANDFPSSRMANDALFRSAELLFLQKEYSEAGLAYSRIIAFGDKTPYWQMAQYKNSWSLYFTGEYQQSVVGFQRLLVELSDAGLIHADEYTDQNGILSQLPSAKREMARDSFRALGLGYAALGSGKVIANYLAENSTNAFYPIIYSNVGDLLIEKMRFTDAATVYEGFAQQYPGHVLAEPFVVRSIEAYEKGGFTDLQIGAKQRYVDSFAGNSTYWYGKKVPSGLSHRLFDYTQNIARYYHAKAQSTAPNDSERSHKFLVAASWYERLLSNFPGAENRAETNLFYADALFDGGKLKQAADQYLISAYDYEGFAKAPDAGLAAVKTYRQLFSVSSSEEKLAVLKQSLDATHRFAESFPQHPGLERILVAAAEDLFSVKDYKQTIAYAGQVLSAKRKPSADITRKALSLTADSHYLLQDYAAADQAYAQLLRVVAHSDSLYALAIERRSVSIYHLAEQARDAGDDRLAANRFLQVANLAVDAGMKANSMFDAGSSLYRLKDWNASAEVLESLRGQFPTNSLVRDADKLLADAYSNSGQLDHAAETYGRIARNTAEPMDVRRSSQKHAAELFDQIGRGREAIAAYQLYLKDFSPALAEAQQIRRRLADIAMGSLKDSRQGDFWLNEIIVADRRAGKSADDSSHQLAAQASMDLALRSVLQVKTVALRAPLEKTLPRRQRAMQAAIDALNQAAGYGYTEITTMATHELGQLYLSLARDLLKSPIPRGLSAEVRDQYQLLLEEEAYPFEEKSIGEFEANLARVQQGVWSEGIQKSLAALSELVPAKYAKHAVVEDLYETVF